jgi:hypothetical protein
MNEVHEVHIDHSESKASSTQNFCALLAGWVRAEATFAFTCTDLCATHAIDVDFLTLVNRNPRRNDPFSKMTLQDQDLA